MKTKLKDSTVDLELTSDSLVSVTSNGFLDMVRALSTLHGTIPMVSYTITRTGVTDEWVVSATAVDTRVYATTMTVVGGVAKYTLTSFPAGTVAEVDAFLALIRLFAMWLKPCNVSLVTIVWG